MVGGQGLMPCPPKLYSLLRNKKKTNYYLIIVLADKTVDLKKLAGELLEDKLSFGSVDDLKKYLSLTIVTIFKKFIKFICFF